MLDIKFSPCCSYDKNSSVYSPRRLVVIEDRRFRNVGLQQLQNAGGIPRRILIKSLVCLQVPRTTLRAKLNHLTNLRSTIQIPVKLVTMKPKKKVITNNTDGIKIELRLYKAKHI